MRPRNWHPLLILLHWATVALIGMQYGLSRLMGDETRELLSRFALYQWHKSFGLTLGGLVLLRLAARFVLPAPAPVPMPRWQRAAAIAHRIILARAIALSSASSPYQRRVVAKGSVRVHRCG